ncbi:MAG: hypothetical protein ACFHWX_19630 [Bacteroidota bacterium]
MKKQKAEAKSAKPIKKKPLKGKKVDAKKQNDHGGIPDMDFKKLMGCG